MDETQTMVPKGEHALKALPQKKNKPRRSSNGITARGLTHGRQQLETLPMSHINLHSTCSDCLVHLSL